MACAIFVEGIAIYVLYSDGKRLHKLSEEQSPQLVRFEQVARWCAAFNVNMLDIYYFVKGQPTKNMAEWKEKTGLDPLHVENFRQYVKDSKK